jgi:hypothetical protein
LHSPTLKDVKNGLQISCPNMINFHREEQTMPSLIDFRLNELKFHLEVKCKKYFRMRRLSSK